MLLWPSHRETSVIGMPLGDGCVAVAQCVRDELRRQSRLPGGAAEVLLVGAADHELALAALEQVPVRGGPVAGDVLVHHLADIRGKRDVAELARYPELQRPELGGRVDLLPDPQGGALVDAAADPDGERLPDPQPAAVHQPDRRGPVG